MPATGLADPRRTLLDIPDPNLYNKLPYNGMVYPGERDRFPRYDYQGRETEMEKEYRMSAESAEKLQEELNYLKTTRSDEVAEQIKIARGFGDLSENSEYDEAKNEQGKLYSRIAELEEILQHVVIVDGSSAPSDIVTIGSRVTVSDEKGKVLATSYKIVGSQEADPMHGIVSEESPFGKALLGAREGDTVTVEAPSGAIHYVVVRIEH